MQLPRMVKQLLRISMQLLRVAKIASEDNIDSEDGDAASPPAFLLAPDWLAPDWLTPDWLTPDWLTPDWLAPDWLAPDWLTPEDAMSVLAATASSHASPPALLLAPD